MKSSYITADEFNDSLKEFVDIQQLPEVKSNDDFSLIQSSLTCEAATRAQENFLRGCFAN